MLGTGTMPYQLHEVLGKGSFGTVYRATDTATGKEYAVKRITVARATHYDCVCVLTELRVLAAHQCPFLVAFREAYVDAGALHLVTEWARHGDLAHLLRQARQNGKRFEEGEVWHFFLQLCIAVDYLHSIKVLHRDLKPANVLVDHRRNVKLADLGVAKLVRADVVSAFTQIGTPCYMSPEIFKRERYGPPTDVWSLGCILHELLTLRPAFDGVNLVALRDKIFRGLAAPRIAPPFGSSPLHVVAGEMLRVHPRARPSLRDVLRRPRVQEELARRGLEALRCHRDAKPLFHAHCVAPRTAGEWQRVAALFCELHATVRLDESVDARLGAVDKLRHALAAATKEDASSSLARRHADAANRLRAAREEVRRLERVVAGLWSRMAAARRSGV